MEKNLNIGCGIYKINGFINLDINEEVNPDLVCDARKLPFEDNSIDKVYFGHCLEHFNLVDARKILKEILRVLKGGCEVGIVVPEKYLTPKNMIDGEDKIYMKHLSYWNLDDLKKEVKKVGFKEIKEMDIETYPNLVARPKWQVGVVAYKEGKKENSECITENIPDFNDKEYSWCHKEKKVVYNPNKKKHCPYCKELLK